MTTTLRCAITLTTILLTAGCGSGDDPTAVQQQTATPPPATPGQPEPPKNQEPSPPAPIPPPGTPTTPPQAPLPTITLSFTGSFVEGVPKIHGTFTYVLTQGPIEQGAHGLTPNVLYSLESWDITVDMASLPATVYRNTDLGNSAEFCLGNCVFASPERIKLTFKNETEFVLQLSFELHDPTPFINPPGSLQEWGALMPNGSHYRVPCPVCVPLAGVATGEVSMTNTQEAL